ncbi:alpha-amylase [Treponema sp. OMZ 840]|uniref:alpha-amylase family glycosyl hydrolase n=1 Tax=Treponema sp. OMZ 840 TaxID=244313 RepID=UPI003D8F38B3
MEFHILKTIRDICKLQPDFFTLTGKGSCATIKEVRLLAKNINDTIQKGLPAQQYIHAGELNAMGLINEILHSLCIDFCKQKNPTAFIDALHNAENTIGQSKLNTLLTEFAAAFPPSPVYGKTTSVETFLAGSTQGEPNKACLLQEIVLLHIAVENPAFSPFLFLFDDTNLAKNPDYALLWKTVQDFFKTQPTFGPNYTDLITLLREPAKASPNSLKGQLDYIIRCWADLIGETVVRLLSAIGTITEEEKPAWIGAGAGGFSPPPMQAYSYDSLIKEYERFSPDTEWMPRVVLMAKTVLVWLDQLSKKYGRDIRRLDHIPDEELNILAERGFTGLWLIGIWQRSWASKRIKQINGNADAAASAYSLYDYDIADELGGWQALDNLRTRLWQRGIRLAADMVPNHTGMDSRWVVEKPDLFMQSKDCPFPSYGFSGENLSLDPRVHVFLENGYFSKTDCAVVFKRVDSYTGDVRYIYHGNDGTGLPWNDTAQIDFLNPQAREEVIQKILHVARNFPIIRFDAAMVLAKKHIRRLWYPEPGCGGDIASRAEHSITNETFEQAIPNEFWREVVDRVASEVPDTLLLAEAFWMMEGYFVRTLGMHRVYNSAFMNMLKKEENYKYRSTIKNTLEFDPQVLKRFVNFMNNPDEETAAVQFGTGDKYFGVCTLMITMPGLPMFGHGQIEGFGEKYGMEFTRAQWNETENRDLVERHNKEIFPLIKKRHLFADVKNFRFYDVWNGGNVNENVFAYTNRCGTEKTAVFYNNVYDRAAGWVKTSCPYAEKNYDSAQHGTDASAHIKTQDFAAALGLTDAKNFYCIFQEQKSRLWFIRANTDLFEKGMFIQLNGFECQVLLNMYEVCDTADTTAASDFTQGRYALLCDALSGKGTESIEEALQDLLFKDLYERLAAFASKEFFAGIAALCLPNLQPKDSPAAPELSELLEKYKKAAFEYFEVLEDFINKDSVNIDGSLVPEPKLPAKPKRADKKSAAEYAWENFTKRIGHLVSLCSHEQKNKDKKNTFINYLYQGLAEQAFMPQSTAAYFILCVIADLADDRADIKKYIEQWNLNRKMDKLLKSYGYISDSTYAHLIRMQKADLLCRYTPLRQNTEAAVYECVSGLIKDKNAPLILGLNLFENIVWFNREKALETVWAFFLHYALSDAKPSSFAAAEKVRQKVITAVEQSSYKADIFTALLEPKKNKQSTKKRQS